MFINFRILPSVTPCYIVTPAFASMLNSQSYHSDQFLKYLSLDMAQVVFSFTIQVSRCVLFLFLSYDNCLFFTYMLTYVFWHLSQLHQITDYWRLLDISLVQTARLFTLWRWGTVVLCKFLGNLKLFQYSLLWKFEWNFLRKFWRNFFFQKEFEYGSIFLSACTHTW
jgi:hypothetical protein